MSIFIKVYDDKFIPSLGRGPILKPTKVSEELYRTLRILGYTTEKINMNKNIITKKLEKPSIIKEKNEIKSIIEKNEEIIENKNPEIPILKIKENNITLEEDIIKNNDDIIEIDKEKKDEKKDYSKLSNSQLRNLLKENNIKFSNASSREKLLELANNNLKI